MNFEWLLGWLNLIIFRNLMLSICFNRMWNVFIEKSIYLIYEGWGEEVYNKMSENLYGFFMRSYYFVLRKYVRLENLKGFFCCSKF